MSLKPARHTFDALTLLVVTTVGLLCGCNNDPLCLPDGEMLKIDWQDVSERIKQVIDVGDLENLTDERLTAKYSTDKIEALVRHPTSTGNRYLLLLQRAGRQQSVVIPGTNLSIIQDVLADLDSTPIMDPELGVEFHRGFYNLSGGLRADLEPLLNPHYVTHLTGYSLGGAMAVILSLQLELHGFDVKSVVTFGQPKVTLASGAYKFSDRPLLRFIAAYDGIPILFTDPAYAHFGEEVILLDGPNLVYLKPSDLNYVLSTNPPAQDPNGALNVKDHGTYMTRIASKLDVNLNPVSYCARSQFVSSE